MKRKDWKYIFFLGIFLCLSLVAASVLHEKIRYNKDLLGLVANIFSILTGFLLLVITTSGETASFTDGLSKSQRFANKRKFETRFNRYMMLFYLYLTVLCLIFFYYIGLPSGDLTKLPQPKPTKISLILEFIICWLSILSFACSFFIPMKLKRLYEEKLQQKV